MTDTTVKRITLSLPSATLSALAAGEQHEDVVLLLHGAGLDSAALSWQPTVEHLSRRYRVIAPDWPGYGQSPAAREIPTTELLVRLTGELVQHTGRHKVILCGLSMGGGVALSYALDHQDRINRLILVGSHGLNTRSPQHILRYLFARMPAVGKWAFARARRRNTLSRSALKSIFHDTSAATDQVMALIIRELERPDAGIATLQWQRSEVMWRRVTTSLIDRLDTLTVPTLLIHGDSDALVPVQGARLAHSLIAGSKLSVIAQCGHWPQREKPTEFIAVLEQFLPR